MDTIIELQVQIEEGKRRHKEETVGEPNIVRIAEAQCKFKKDGGHGLRFKPEILVSATIVGAYFYDRWHPFVYKAYHVILNDGTKTTIPAQWVVKYWR